MTLRAQLALQEPMDAAELISETTFLLERGTNPDEIPARLGVRRDNLAMRLRRHGHPDLATRIDNQRHSSKREKADRDT